MSTPVVQCRVVVKNPQGLHARPAEVFARTAMKYESEVIVIRENLRVDGKSILNVLTLGAAQGVELTLEATGSDAQQAIDALFELISNDFADETISRENAG